MFACKRTSQKGFSLVELMVVVAIIGVLASIAVPQVNKFIAKSRQSEAKTNLASYYTSQKAFQAEYGVYDGRFQAIGFAPEGQLRYNVGHTAATAVAGVTHGYNTTLTGTMTGNTVAHCGTGGVVNANRCAMVLGAGGAAVPTMAGTTLSGTAFSVRAMAVIMNGAGNDVWQITDTKALTNPTNGIP